MYIQEDHELTIYIHPMIACFLDQLHFEIHAGSAFCVRVRQWEDNLLLHICTANLSRNVYKCLQKLSRNI